MPRIQNMHHDGIDMNAGRNPATSAGEVDTLNSLLRGEIAAVETYDQAIEKLHDSDEYLDAQSLRRIREEHADHVAKLQTRIRAHGGEPSDGAGAWGVFANAVQGAAKLLGPQTALAALKQGEEHGINDYEQALQGDDLSTENKHLIRSDLLPRCQQHLSELDQIRQQIELAEQ